MTIPDRAQTVVVGGGVIGASIAYHLAVRGRTDVTLVERKTLTQGSTWHAAGLVGQLRSSRNLTELMRASAREYATLEQITGYATGWRGVGSVRVASSDERWQELKRAVTAGRSFGFDVHLVSAAEACDLYPLLDPDGVRGATWIPSDGYVDPNQLTHSYITGARAAGIRIVQNCRVTGVERTGRRVTAVLTEHGRIECDSVVNATGMWGNETAQLAGVSIAVTALEHQYLVTEKSERIPRDLPTFRDPDGRFYVKPEASALAIGGWEDGTRAPWRTIPRELDAHLFEENVERFAPLGEQVTKRLPYFGDVGIHTWVNGPIPFTPDAEPLMGITEDFDNLFHCCGFSSGIAAAGGAGIAMANWVVDGDPGMDLWPFDVRRFGPPHQVPAALERRAIHAYANYYSIAHPNREADAVRGQRRSPLYDRLAGRGAVFGAKFGYERPNWFAPTGVVAPAGVVAGEHPSFGRSDAFEPVGVEHRAVREGVALIDMSSFSKYEIAGPGALGLLQAVAGADLDTKIGRISYTQLLNVRGGIEADVTITRLAEDRFYFVTGSAFGRHDLAFIRQHAPVDGSVAITDVTSANAVINLCGPRSRAVLHELGVDVDFPYLAARFVDVGYASMLALRTTYVGELGWELHIPSEYARDVYDQLLAAGEQFGIRDAGYRAVNSLRLEKQYLAWAVDITADSNPYEAGLAFCTRPDKPELLAGPALRKIRDNGPTRRLCWFTASGEITMHGGELLAHRGGAVSGVLSAGYGYTVDATIFSAYLPVELADESEFEVEVLGERYPAARHDAPRYDPTGSRVRG